MKILANVLNWIFPVSCISCGENTSDFCPKCLLSLPQAERQTLDWVYPTYDYRNKAVKKAVWCLKYKSNRRLAEIFAEIIHNRIMEELSDLSVMEDFNAPILIPIPLSKKRHRERGFNQSELISQSIIDNDAGKYFKLFTNILTKPKETKHQAHIEDRIHRMQNIIGSFAVKNQELIKGQNIILIDDVVTTGATLNEAKKILIEAGARKIIAFTIAH